MESIPEFITIGNNNEKFHCGIWNKNLGLNRHMGKISRHIESKSHKNEVKRREKEKDNTQYDFEFDLVELLILLMLPLSLVDNKVFRAFLWKYTKFTVPYSCEIREKDFVKNMGEDTLDEIRKELDGKKISIQADTSSDNRKSFVTNVIIRELNETNITKAYLIDVISEHKAHSGETFAKLIHVSLMKFFNGNFNMDNVKLLVTDQAAYCRVAGTLLKNSFYSNIIHITCLAHMLHNLTKKISSSFLLFLKFVSIFNRIYSRSIQQKSILLTYVNKLPKSPVITSWGTYLEFGEYVFNNYIKLTEYAKSLKSPKNKDLFDLLSNHQFFNELSLFNQFVFLVGYIKDLERNDIELNEQIKIIIQVQTFLTEFENKYNEKKLNFFHYSTGLNSTLFGLNIARSITKEQSKNGKCHSSV